jgi:hypothetical protein
VYEYPRGTKQKAKLAEGLIVVADQRTDKSLDKFISVSVPDVIRGVLSREIAATGCMDGSLPGNPEVNTLPVQIQVDLLKTSVEVPSHVSNAENALGAAGLIAGLVTGGVALVPLVQYEYNYTDVVGEIQMRVHFHNVQSGIEWEDTWTGATTIRVPIADKGTPQTNSKTFGAALKDAMSHLPDALAHVGIEP